MTGDLKNIVRCPRCGYDQRGTVATWREQCPLTGICTECGLDWLWAELVSDKVRKPSWCVEYAAQWLAVPWRSVKTLAMTFWPWRFWKSLKMSHEPRWGRIIVYLVMLISIAYVGFAIAQGCIARRYLVSYLSASGYTSSVSQWQMFLRAAATPLSSTSFGKMSPPVYGANSTRPSGILATVSASLPAPRDFCMGFWYVFIGPLFWCVLAHVLCAVGFAALPQSRRLAKVRWRHIIRITAYGAAIFAPAVMLFLLALFIDELSFQIGPAKDQLLDAASIVLIAALPLDGIWWSLATSRYLRMRHGWGVGISVVLMAWLASFLCFLGVFIAGTP